MTDPDLARALREREEAIEARAAVLLEDALSQDAPWLRRLGAPPAGGPSRRAWLREARTVAAYRDRWEVAAGAPVDPESAVGTIEQRGHRKRALAAAARAVKIAEQAHGTRPAPTTPRVDVEPLSPRSRGPER